MRIENRVALLLVIVFMLLVIILAIERALIAKGELTKLYKPATSHLKP